MEQMHALRHPTEHFTISEPRNPSIPELNLVQNCQSIDFEAQKLSNDRSGSRRRRSRRGRGEKIEYIHARTLCMFAWSLGLFRERKLFSAGHAFKLFSSSTKSTSPSSLRWSFVFPWYPTDTFINLEHQNSPLDALYVVPNNRLTDSEAVKSCKI